uniref:Acyltransferase 3 domain-containing protein n=1 Tax=Chromera velia CCMP2878 TaxID=1169474 RepID=A0A0G4I813_9ALVE|eukprot:Cvel_11747.t1-p1 / transcript=Cvel_11747.t1 / gene=Cvel_11747 / organism=Chromera_velia_CCMP2878 / gene_product=O-acetyltransferase OatA, putative / transcript_product=O-acetyltransferase OatA, putative / location=Cvel_scaffold746:50210-52352(+) / protein_length=612 / sequence_SO=supercontig / SO=protein_coding / is_pseudo=false
MVNRSAFREDIEALRGFAILLVVFFHAQVPCFAAGFVGVDIFFTISGFVITRSLISENQKTGSIDLWGFYSRRIGRLLPASLLLAASVVIASLFISSSPEFVLDAKDAIVAVLYGLNIQQALTADDYFQEREEDRQTPLLHFWSLNVEEQFYILWPLLMKLCCQFRGRQIFLVLAACGLMGGSFVFNIYYTENNQPFAFYLPVSRAWQFGAGGLCAWLQEKPLSGTWKVLTQAIFYLGLVVSLLFLNSERTWPGYWALIPTVFTMAYIAGFEEGPEAFHPHAERPTESAYSAELVGSQGRLGFLRGPFDTVASGVWKSMLFLGQLSYSWYLWHWPFQIFFLRLFPDASVAAQAWAGTFALAPAWLSFVFLEAPLRAAAKKSTNSMSIIFKGAVAMLVFVVASWFLIISHSLTPASSPTTVGTVQWQQQQQQQQQQEDQQQKAPQFGKADGLSSVSEGGEIEELTLPPQRQAPLNLYAPEKNQSPSVHGTNEDGSVGTVGGQRDWGDDFIFKNSTFGELKVDLWLKMLRPSLGECPEARPEEAALHFSISAGPFLNSAVPKNPLPAKLKRTGMCSLYGNGTQIVSTGPRYGQQEQEEKEGEKADEGRHGKQKG